MHEIPVKRKKLGTIIRKGGEWYDNHSRCDPHDTIEGYVLEVTHNMLKEREEYLRKENRKYLNQIQSLKEDKQPDTQEGNQDHLNLMIDIARLEKIIRRLDKRSRKSKDDDVTVRCANAVGLLEGKKLQLILAVTGVTRIIKKDKRFNN